MALVTVQELAKILKVKGKTLYQWAEQGQIPCLKINGSLRFDINQVNKWLQSCQRPVVSGYNPSTKLGGSGRR